MIEEIVKKRMALTGLTQAKLSEMTGCTATQMGIFLKGTGFLNRVHFEKCMDILGIRIDMYAKRYELAQLAAAKLKGYSNDDIIAMPKNKMAEVTGLENIACLFDVSESELDAAVNSGIVDYESTYPFFKATVLYMMQLGDKITPKTVETSFSKLASALAISPAIPLLGVAGMIGIATGFLLHNKKYSSIASSTLAPLTLASTKNICGAS